MGNDTKSLLSLGRPSTFYILCLNTVMGHHDLFLLEAQARTGCHRCPSDSSDLNIPCVLSSHTCACLMSWLNS